MGSSNGCLTAKQVKEKFQAEGITFSKWAKEHGYRANQVYRVVNGQSKAKYGKDYEVAVKLGLKDKVGDEENLKQEEQVVSVEMECSSSIGNRLKEVRKELGLTQDSAPELCLITRESWNRHEKGKMLPGFNVLKELASTGGDINYIITGQRLEPGITDPQEIAYLKACRELPTPEAREVGIDALKAVAKHWEPGISVIGRRVSVKNETSLLGRFSINLRLLLARITAVKRRST